MTNTLDAFQNKLSGIAENGDKSLLNYIKSFKEQITHVINLLATQLSEHQEKEILKTIEHILNTNAVSEKLTEEINRVDIPNSLESINDKLGAVAK